MRVPERIELFKAGDEVTPLHVHRINELIRAINALLSMRGEGSVRVHHSDGGIVITNDDPTEAT